MAKAPKYLNVDGIRFPPIYTDEMIKAAKSYRPDKEDVVVATYPKAGTTWTNQIASLILRKGKLHTSTEDYFTSVPQIEGSPHEKLDKLPRPRCFKTHLPFNWHNFSDDAKYIWTVRHPADTVVSLYHYVKFYTVYCFSYGTFDEFFYVFVKGECNFGDYFDHVLSWYGQRHRPNILCMTYEEMQKDLRSAVLKIARHIGEEHYESLLENDEDILKKVLHYSSFEYMRENVERFFLERYFQPTIENAQNDKTVQNAYDQVEDAKKCGHELAGNFIRKGKVGDWKIMLSEEQKERLKARIKDKTKNSDVMELWKDYEF